MRWKDDEPKVGEKRTVKFYAFVPTKLNDGWVVWLESYYAEEEYIYFSSEGYSKWIVQRTWLFDKPDTAKPSAGSYIKGKK